MFWTRRRDRPGRESGEFPGGGDEVERPRGLQHFKYWGFISYSHRDQHWGTWLHRSIEGYRVPRRLVGRLSVDGAIPRRLFPLFRDTDELPAAGSLTDELREALRSSKYILVICSPFSVKSPHVDAEVRYFKSLGRADRVLCLIVAGEPNVSTRSGDVDRECFPAAVCRDVLEDGRVTDTPAEPIAADAREGRRARHPALLRLLAGMLGIGYDELRQRDRQRRRRRTLGAIASTVVVLGALAFSWQWQEWQKQREILRQTIEGYTVVGQKELGAGNFNQAAVFLAEAYRLGEEGVRLRLLLAHALRGIDLQEQTQSAGRGEVRLLRADGQGRFLVSVTGTNDVALWDAEGKRLATLDHGRGRVEAVAFSPDGNTLFTGGVDGVVRGWNTRTGEAVARLEGPRAILSSIAVGRDGRFLTSIGADGSAVLWRRSDGRPVASLSAGVAIRAPAVFSPDGDRLATLGYMGDRLLLWDTASGRLLHSVGLAAKAEALHYSADGGTILVGGERGPVELREGATGQTAGRLPSELRNLIHLGMTSDRGHAVLVDAGGVVEVWDVSKRRALLAFDTGVRGGLVVDFDGRRLVLLTGDPEPAASIWSVETGTEIAVLHVLGTELRTAALRPGTGVLVTGSKTGSLTTWNLDRRARNFSLPGHQAMVNLVEFSPDGRRLVTAGSEASATVWDTDTGRSLAKLELHEAAVYQAKWGSDGTRLVTVSGDGTIALWNAETFKPIRHATRVGANRVAVAPIRDLLVAVSTGAQAFLWRPDAGPIVHLDRMRTSITDLAFSPDGSLLVTGNDDGSLEVWDSATGQARHRLWTHREAVTSVDVSRDGSRLLSTSNDSTAIVWSMPAGTLSTVFAGHTAAVAIGRFAPDGRTVVTAGHDGTAKLWKAATGTVLSSLSDQSGSVTSAAFSPDGALVATAGDDRSVRLWDVVGGKLIRSLPPHAGPILGIAFSPRGDLLASAAKDTVARIWDVRPEQRPRDEIATLLGQRSRIRIADGRLTASPGAAGGAPDARADGARGPAANMTRAATAERAVELFLEALGRADGPAVNALIAAKAERRLVDLRDSSPDKLKDLGTLFRGARATVRSHRSDGNAATVTLEIPRGRIDVFLEREVEGWKLANVRARTNRESEESTPRDAPSR